MWTLSRKVWPKWLVASTIPVLVAGAAGAELPTRPPDEALPSARAAFDLRRIRQEKSVDRLAEAARGCADELEGIILERIVQGRRSTVRAGAIRGDNELESFHLACDLRVAAARWKNDSKAQIAATESLERRLSDSIEVEKKLQEVGLAGPYDPPLALYRECIAARKARLRKDRTAEVAALKKAVALAETWKRESSKVIVLGRAPAKPLPQEAMDVWLVDPIRALCVVQLELIEASATDRADARKAKIKALEAYVTTAQRTAESARIRSAEGLSSSLEEAVADFHYRHALALLANERGDTSARIAAWKKAAAAAEEWARVFNERRIMGRAGRFAPAGGPTPPDHMWPFLDENACLAECRIAVATLAASGRKDVQDAMLAHLTAAERELIDAEIKSEEGLVSTLEPSQAAARYLLVRFQIAEFDKANKTTTPIAPLQLGEPLPDDRQAPDRRHELEPPPPVPDLDDLPPPSTPAPKPSD